MHNVINIKINSFKIDIVEDNHVRTIECKSKFAMIRDLRTLDKRTKLVQLTFNGLLPFGFFISNV